MMASASFPRWQLFSSFSSASLLMMACCLPMSAQAQQLSQAQPNVQVVTPTLPEGGVYTIQGGQRLISEAARAVSAQDLVLATKRLQDARLVMNQLSNFYQGLSSSFLGIDSLAYDSSRRKALEAAQLRDQATYQLALVYRARNQPELAIPLLVEVIRSQNPSRDMGQQAYRQLLELGFVDVPFPRAGAVPPAAPPPPPRPPAAAPGQPPARPPQ